MNKTINNSYFYECFDKKFNRFLKDYSKDEASDLKRHEEDFKRFFASKYEKFLNNLNFEKNMKNIGCMACNKIKRVMNCHTCDDNVCIDCSKRCFVRKCENICFCCGDCNTRHCCKECFRTYCSGHGSDQLNLCFECINHRFDSDENQRDGICLKKRKNK